MFTLTPIGLQPNIVVDESNLSSPSTGNIQISDHIKPSNLQIDCAGDFYDISHSLLKLAWTTKDPSSVGSQV